MAEPKTKPTTASIDDYLASRANPEQDADCRALMTIMRRVTGEAGKMWGPSILGLGGAHRAVGGGHAAAVSGVRVVLTRDFRRRCEGDAAASRGLRGW